MGLLSDVLFFPVMGPVHGLGFILKRIQQQVEEEWLDESKIQTQLMQLGLRYDLGEITESDYLAQESALLERLSEIREYKESRAREAEEQYALEVGEGEGEEEAEVAGDDRAAEDVEPDAPCAANPSDASRTPTESES